MWFEREGFEPAIDPDFDAWTVRTHAVEIPDGPTGRVVCELRGLPDVRVALRLSVATGALVGLEVGDRDLFARGAPPPRRVHYGGTDFLLGVEIHAPDPPREPDPISARLLRKIPFGELERSARAELRWELATRAHSADPTVKASLQDGGASLREALTHPRPGRRGNGDLVYAELAARYVELLGTGQEVKQLAAEHFKSPARVRNMLSDARRKGLLTRPPAQGKSGGQLTPRALAILGTPAPVLPPAAVPPAPDRGQPPRATKRPVAAKPASPRQLKIAENHKARVWVALHSLDVIAQELPKTKLSRMGPAVTREELNEMARFVDGAIKALPALRDQIEAVAAEAPGATDSKGSPAFITGDPQ